MPHFRATNKLTAEVVEYDATLPQEAHRGAGWWLEDVSVAPLSPTEPETPPFVYAGRRILTQLEFMRLFTVPERVAMRRAAKLDEVMEDYLDLMRLAQEINLDDPDTIAGVQMMEGAELIGEGRAAEVLSG